MTQTPEPQVITFGCRLNVYESEVMRQHAKAQGLENAIIINTCAVTNEAERQARQAVRRARRDHPEATIIVAGCSAQQNPDLYAAMPEVNYIMGNENKLQRASYDLATAPRINVSDIMAVQEIAPHMVTSFDGHVRAFIEIQNGCDHRCTFCSIPLGRGNNRSVPMGEIVQQVRHLVAQGCREVVLTGVDITGYGTDLPGTPTLGSMMRRLLQAVPELPRLRLSSIDPKEIDDQAIALILHEPRLMPHIHLSIQAGDDMILKRMKRRHLRQDVLDLVTRLREARPEIAFGADLIAGFPTEDEAMFNNTLTLVADANITFVHAFPYSPRAGTPAARMPQVARAIIKERAARLRQVAAAQLSHYLASRIGQTESVLIESNLKGHTASFAEVDIVGEATEHAPALRGQIRQAMVEGVHNNRLQVRLI
ncbi:MAG: tRNA (N(6)-L-threonylcarbamoyladenosine(37)-C(2))-methylthiotransferase MtaB [Holosporales bacterium]